ncbi:MAG: cystathionine beta-lyase [Alphaproteobacteria bacterium]|nr:cystathionine beta-lyase [Alphaproteobacteria bacterium]
MSKKDNKDRRELTRMMHLGRAPEEYFGIVNPPISRTSTILFPSLADYEDKDRKFRYARMGNPLSDKFECAVAEIENGYAAISTPSGLTSISTTLLAFLKTGDHLLISDSLYPPARSFCENILARFGVEVEYYDPLIGAGIAEKIKDNTAVIYMESPGSATFEIQDVPAITKVAKAHNIITVADNSWAAGILFKPLNHGVDISLQSATKYIGGHSDINLGVAVARTPELYTRLKKSALDIGVCAGAEDLYLALRGLRTLHLRLQQCARNAMIVAEWLQTCEEVQRIYFPALPGDSNHALWKRDFSGTNGVLSFLLRPASKARVSAFVNGLELFPVGSSWGGYESLLQPQYLNTCRTAVPWVQDGALLRLQIGLEDPQDLIDDLSQAFTKFNQET